MRALLALRIVALVFVVAQLGCGGHDEAKPAPPPKPDVVAPQATRWYVATIASSKGDVPFFLGLEPVSSDHEHAIIVNGKERLTADVELRGTHRTITFPIFGTRIELDPRSDGTLTGSRIATLLGGTPQKVVARPTPQVEPHNRFPPLARASTHVIDFSGGWQVKFDKLGAGRGTFQQDVHGTVEGTFLLERFGDMRYLAGRAEGDVLRLSTFDGQHAYAFRLEAVDENHLKGEWIDADEYFGGPFTATREGGVIDLFVGAGDPRIGKRLSLPVVDDPAYAGKPMVVDLFGTWCPACIDAEPFLDDLYRDYHPKGLELVSVAYEFRNADENKAFVDRFVQHYHVPWKVLVVDASLDTLETQLPAELHDNDTWPAAVFLDRNHKIRAIHHGFIGPAAGAAHEAMNTRWRTRLDELVK